MVVSVGGCDSVAGLRACGAVPRASEELVSPRVSPHSGTGRRQSSNLLQHLICKVRARRADSSTHGPGFSLVKHRKKSQEGIEDHQIGTRPGRTIKQENRV
jgi:hypothetical protein